MTIEEQIVSHVMFLKKEQIAMDDLLIDQGFIRCHIVGESIGRGELCYQTKKTLLRNGLIGLATWLRTKGGEIKTHKTYGLPNTTSLPGIDLEKIKNREASEKAKIFWNMSDQIGEAEYLLKKGVGYYGIRFRQTEHGKVAVIPMGDVNGKLYSYQLINADGSKRFAKDVGILGLMHMLHRPINGFAIGLAESYVTAASCFEVTGITMVTSFSSENLKLVGKELRNTFPQSPLIIFGDNDRHLKENKGKQAAYAAQVELGNCCQIVTPDFEGYQLSREFSDWNDYVRENGIKTTREAIQKTLNKD
ncbi:MAG TPA: toprim domain-containing protein [Bacteroidia bacterium]|nr:toprim domain-containing protein [Bacteroidia bacterium]